MHPFYPAVGRVLVDVLLVLALLLGAWFIGDWIFGSVERDQIHPGWFVPTVASGLIMAMAAAAVGQPAVASAGLHWLGILTPPGQAVYEYLLLAAISALGGGVAVRTVVALVQHRLIPA